MTTAQKVDRFPPGTISLPHAETRSNLGGIFGIPYHHLLLATIICSYTRGEEHVGMGVFVILSTLLLHSCTYYNS